MKAVYPDAAILVHPESPASVVELADAVWMAMNGLKAIETALREGGEQHEIFVDEALRVKSLIPLNRMLDFAEKLNMQVKGNA